MKFSVFFFILLISLPILASEPETVLPKTKVIKPVNWYSEQAALWKEKLQHENTNSTAWLNYYVAARYANTTPEELTKLLLAMEGAVPNAIELDIVKGLQLNYSGEAFEFFKKAHLANPDHSATYAPLVLCYELQLDNANRKRLSKKLLEADLISSSLLNYSYNVLMSLEAGAILITEGENTVLPVFVLQDVM